MLKITIPQRPISAQSQTPLSPQRRMRRNSSSAAFNAKPTKIQEWAAAPYVEQVAMPILQETQRHRPTFLIGQLISEAKHLNAHSEKSIKALQKQSISLYYRTDTEVLEEMLKEPPTDQELIAFLKRYTWEAAAKFCQEKGAAGFELMQRFANWRKQYLHRILQLIPHEEALEPGSKTCFSDIDIAIGGKPSLQRQAINHFEQIAIHLGFGSNALMWDLNFYALPEASQHALPKTSAALLLSCQINQIASLLAIYQALTSQEWTQYKNLLPNHLLLDDLPIGFDEKPTATSITLAQKVETVYETLSADIKKEVLINVAYGHLEDLATALKDTTPSNEKNPIKQKLYHLIASNKNIITLKYPLYCMAENAVRLAYAGDQSKLDEILASIATTQTRSHSIIPLPELMPKVDELEAEIFGLHLPIDLNENKHFLDRLAELFCEKNPNFKIVAMTRVKEKISAYRVLSVETHSKLLDKEKNQTQWLQSLENFLAQGALLSQSAFNWVVRDEQLHEKEVVHTVGTQIDTVREMARFCLECIDEMEGVEIQHNRRLVLELSKHLFRAKKILEASDLSHFEDLLYLKKHRTPKNMFEKQIPEKVLKKLNGTNLSQKIKQTTDILTQTHSNEFTKLMKGISSSVFQQIIQEFPEMTNRATMLVLCSAIGSDLTPELKKTIQLHYVGGFIGDPRDTLIDTYAQKIGLDVKSPTMHEQARDLVLHLLFDTEKKFQNYSISDLAKKWTKTK